MLQIVIPAYNEEGRLPRTLRDLRRHVAARRGVLGRVEVLVVDNASTDRTAEVARAADSPALPVRVLRCARRGKGAAVRAGLMATDADLVCFMDADGATGLDAVEEAWRRLLLGADVVIGSRALPGSDTEARHCRTRSAGAAASSSTRSSTSNEKPPVRRSPTTRRTRSPRKNLNPHWVSAIPGTMRAASRR